MSKKNNRQRRHAEEVEFGSGNVFADLGLPNAGELYAKAELASQIRSLIAEAGLTQAQAAKRLGIDQPRVSELTRGLLRGFSIERMLKFLNMLDRDVIITLRLPDKGHQPGVRVMALA